MKILIANIGSTSLKWRLFDFSNGAGFVEFAEDRGPIGGAIEERAEAFEKEALAQDVLVLALTKNLVRAVTHLDVGDVGIARALEALARAVQGEG